MSQRVFTKGNLEVLTGWDAPLQYFFLVIENKAAATDDPHDGYVFNNLKRKKPGMELEEIVAMLNSHGITPPPSLIADLERDRRNNDQNLYYNYDNGDFRT